MIKILTFLRDARQAQTRTMPIFKKSCIGANRLKLSEQQQGHSFDNWGVTTGAANIEDFDPVYRKKDFKKIQQSVLNEMGLTKKFTSQ